MEQTKKNNLFIGWLFLIEVFLFIGTGVLIFTSPVSALVFLTLAIIIAVKTGKLIEENAVEKWKQTN